jgi:hypothetical protein
VLGAQAGFDVGVCFLCLYMAVRAHSDRLTRRPRVSGAEVGYYYGAAKTWLALAAQQPQLVSDR